MEVNRDLLPPLVFTCGQCHRILTDSQEFICSIEDIELIVMKGATGIAIDKIQQKCSLSSGNDSTYYSVLCDHCGVAVGRLYLSTPEILRCLEGGFSFDAKAINSHQLGQCEVRAIARDAQEEYPSGGIAITAAPQVPSHSQATGASAPSEQILMERMEQLEADLIKVQNILLLHNEKLETIESAAVTPVPLLPTQQGSATQIPCSRSTEPATNYSGGEDCGLLVSEGTMDEGAAADSSEQAAEAHTSRGNDAAGPSCLLQHDSAPSMNLVQSCQGLVQEPVCEADLGAKAAQSGGHGQKRARKRSAVT